MTRGESEVGNADVDALLLAFMKVVLAQHRLFYHDELNESNASVKLNLRYTNNIFEGLGCDKQSVNTQWMLILKLYRTGCIQEFNFYNNQPDMDIESFLNYRFDYRTVDDEVELVLIPDVFLKIVGKLEQVEPTNSSSSVTYSCRLFLRDNRVMISLNEKKFQVARVNSGSVMEDLFLWFGHRPSMEPLTAMELRPNDKNFSFIRTLDKNKYRWLRVMLSVYEAKTIAIKNPSELSTSDLLAMLPEIAENYRQPIESYLGLE